MAQLTFLPKIHRRYIYGTDYIDEVVQQHNFTTTGAQSTYHVLQDANWNVIALATAGTGTVAQQYSYEPHGPYLTIEYGSGQPVSIANILTNRAYATGIYSDPLKLTHFRSRDLYGSHGRFIQGDTNALGFHMSSLPHYHGMSLRLSPYVTSRGQYVDGLNRYGYAQFNPNMYTDPMGYFSYIEIMGTSFKYASQGYSWYSLAKDVKEAAQALRNGASLRNIAFDFMINAAADAAFGKALDVVVGAGAKVVGDFAEGFRKGAKKADDEIDDIRKRARAKPIEEHHLIPKGETAFLSRYNEILSKYGLDVKSDDLPKIHMHHRGRHPTEYQQMALEMLNEADKYAKGDPQLFLAFLETMAEGVRNSPELLMRDWYR